MVVRVGVGKSHLGYQALLKGALIVSDSIHHLQITHCASSCAKAES